ncbi:MAG: hypothetical protein DMF81_20580, partial [Acidobacteria bacterium]
MPAPPALLVGPGGPQRERISELLREAGLEVTVLSESDALARRELPPARLLVLAHRGSRTDREAAQVRLLSHPALHGVPLLVVGPETDVESYGGALARGAAAYVSSDAGPGELHDLALRLVRAADRRTASLAGRPARPERRRTRRPLLLKVEVEDRRGGARLAGHIVDVGLSGCRLELGTSLARGTPVGLQLHAYRESTGIVLAGSVRWTRPDE